MRSWGSDVDVGLFGHGLRFGVVGALVVSAVGVLLLVSVHLQGCGICCLRSVFHWWSGWTSLANRDDFISSLISINCVFFEKAPASNSQNSKQQHYSHHNNDDNDGGVAGRVIAAAVIILIRLLWNSATHNTVFRHGDTTNPLEELSALGSSETNWHI